jgi:hypothetical protein
MHIAEKAATFPLNSTVHISSLFQFPEQHFSSLRNNLLSLTYAKVGLNDILASNEITSCHLLMPKFVKFDLSGGLWCRKSGFLNFKNCVIKQMELTTQKLHFPHRIFKKKTYLWPLDTASVIICRS